jgi:hypothetical protein
MNDDQIEELLSILGSIIHTSERFYSLTDYGFKDTNSYTTAEVFQKRMINKVSLVSLRKQLKKFKEEGLIYSQTFRLYSGFSNLEYYYPTEFLLMLEGKPV